MRSLLKVSISLLAILVILGCGGGNSSSSGDTNSSSSGGSSGGSTDKPVKPTTNKAPIANAGGNRAVQIGKKVTFDASSSTDSDGTIVKYEWFEGKTPLHVGKSFFKSDFPLGLHEITLVVTDNEGATGKVTINIIISENTPVNVPPTAKITTDKTSAKVGETIIFSSKNSTDSDGYITSRSWLDGLTPISTQESFGESNLTEGTHTIKLIVTDNSGATDEDTITIEIINNPPLFVSSNPKDSATNISKDVNPSVTFDEDIDIKNALISFKQGSSDIAFTKSVSGSSFTIKPSAKLSANTKYTLTFSKVEDTYGLAFVGEKTISFTTAQDANFDSSTRAVSVDENQKDALTIKANGANLTYTISGGDSDDFTIDSQTGKVTFKKAPDYETKNSYTFTAYANDGSATASQAITVNINNLIEHIAPELSDTSLNNIYASLPIGTTIGKVIVAKNGDDAITSFTLSGTNKDDFSVNASGDVKIAKALDFATKPSYSLEVFATNATGNSQKVGLSIKLTDKAILSALVQDSKNGMLGFSGTTYHSILSSDKKTLYTTNNWKFKVYDTHDLTNMKLLNSGSSIEAYKYALSSDEKTAYILEYDRLTIHNISDLENIQTLGNLSLDISAQFTSITIKDNILYIGDIGKDKIYVVDVSDKSNPSLLQTEDIKVQSDLLIVDDKLYFDYLDGSYHLASYDIGVDKKLSNKTDLISKYVKKLIVSADKKMIFYIGTKKFGIYTIATNSTKEITISSNPLSSMKISDDENTAYIGGANEFIEVDISDKTNPAKTGTTPISVTPSTINILNSDTFLFSGNSGVSVYNTKLTLTPYITNLVSKRARKVKLSEDEKSLFVGSDNIFYIYDISSNTEKGSFPTGNISDVAISKDEKTAFVVSSYAKYFKILDISNPSSISETKAITMTDKPFRVALSHDGKYAFITQYSSTLIYDINNLSSPTKIGTVPVGEGPAILTNDDKYLFVEKSIYDISNLASPNEVNTIGAFSLAISEDGKFLYASDFIKAIKIYDISTPNSPKEKGTLDMGKSVGSIHTTEDENTIFVRTDSGLYSIDVSDKNAPKVINSHDIDSYDTAISKDLKSIYIGGNRHLSKLDLTLATLYKRKNFADFDISLIISDNLGKNITMTATDDGKNIVTIGSYNSTLTPSDYTAQKVTIPISAKTDKTGTTVITVDLNDGVNTLTKKIYLNVID